MTPDELDRLADEATPGPWEYADLAEDDGGHWPVVRTPENAWIAQGERCFKPETEKANMRLIALAPTLAREHAALLRWADQAAEVIEQANSL